MKTLIAALLISIYLSVPAYAGVQIPPRIQNLLNEKRCELVETFDELSGEKITAATTGNFSNSEKNDWAFLCAEYPEPTLLVIFSEPNDCPAAFQTGGDSVFPASIDLMKRHIKNYRPNGNYPELTHEGIGVGFGQASITYYCHRGRWLELPGSD